MKLDRRRVRLSSIDWQLCALRGEGKAALGFTVIQPGAERRIHRESCPVALSPGKGRGGGICRFEAASPFQGKTGVPTYIHRGAAGRFSPPIVVEWCFADSVRPSGAWTCRARRNLIFRDGKLERPSLERRDGGSTGENSNPGTRNTHGCARRRS